MNKVQQFFAKHLLGFDAKAFALNNGSQATGSGGYVFREGQLIWMADNGQSYVKDAYAANDIIFSAINMIMEKARVAPWGLYTVKDETALKRYKAMQSGRLPIRSVKDVMDAQFKALEPVANYDTKLGKINDLLQWSNEYCTFQDLVADGIGFKLITGNKMLFADIIPAGANKGLPNEFYNMPAQFMRLVATRNFPQKVVGYQLHSGEIRNFSKEEVMHERFFNPDYDLNGSALYGQSPIKAAAMTVTRNNSAKKAGAYQLQNNGAAGIAYIDDAIVPVSGRATQVDAVKQAWAKEYTGEETYGKVAFSGYKMGYVPVGASLKDMALGEIEAVDLRRLANIWGLPSQLLNDPDNKSYNNQKEAEKALTSRCTLPHLTSFRDNLNRKLQTDWGLKGKKVVVDFDLSVYPELQEDQKEKWSWVKELPVSNAYKLEMMGLDVPDDPNLQVILVDGNLMPLEDVVNKLTEDQMNAINDSLNKAGLKY